MLGIGGKRQRTINLALQGGGVHGAFTWGVLDRLLEDDKALHFSWISATSAGAVNAAALASGLANGGREEARRSLRRVWEAVQEAGVPDLVRLNPFLRGLGRPSSLAPVAALFSPYEFNPLGFDPLRRILSEHIDFQGIRAYPDLELLVAATDVATGAKRLFRRPELSVEAVLASACLPTIHHAVEIEGRAYWDGGFSANPDLVTLADESPTGDTLLVLLNAFDQPGVPRSAREIAGTVSRITFNQPLRRDIEQIEAARATSELGWWGRARTPAQRLAKHRFHLVEAGHHTAFLPADSKIQPDRTIISRLFLAGHSEAGKWLERHGADIGRRSTVDLGALLGRVSSPIARTREADAPTLDEIPAGADRPRSAPASRA
ncbi:MAG: patatin-like phospholipase family protein [Hyphomicrobiaceae bacterium]